MNSTENELSREADQASEGITKTSLPVQTELVERLREIVADGDANGEAAMYPTTIYVRNYVEKAADALSSLSSREKELEGQVGYWQREAKREEEHGNERMAQVALLRSEIETLKRERDEAVKQERESCAFDAECVSGFGDPWTIETIAANIRARGPEDEKELVHVSRETWERLKASESSLQQIKGALEAGFLTCVGGSDPRVIIAFRNLSDAQAAHRSLVALSLLGQGKGLPSVEAHASPQASKSSVEASREAAPMTFPQWLAALDQEAKRRGYEGESITQETGEECWRSYYDDGCSPKDAMDEEATYQ